MPPGHRLLIALEYSEVSSRQIEHAGCESKWTKGS